MKSILNILLFCLLAMIFSSCAVEGDEVSGVWFTNGALGRMKIEVKPSNGTFVGYLLEYEKNGKLIPGGNSQQDIIFNNLKFKDEKYLGGSFLVSTKGNNPCDLKLAFSTEGKQSMKAAYLCNGDNRLEYWYRDKYHDKPVLINNVNTVNLEDLLKANKIPLSRGKDKGHNIQRVFENLSRGYTTSCNL